MEVGERGGRGRGCVMPKKWGGGEHGSGVGAVLLSGNLGLAVIPCQLRKMYILLVHRGITTSLNCCLFLGVYYENLSVFRYASPPRGI